MKARLHLVLLPALAFALSVSVPSLRAQSVEGTPTFVDYQGTVFDAQGFPLGSKTGGTEAEPENYLMEFRIYDQQSDGGTLIWAETQTVTVSLGAFSVRLGSGAEIADLVPSPQVSNIANAFREKERYLELRVQLTGETDPTAITPRLAFQSSPFAFVAERAVRADSVGSTTAGELRGNFEGTVTATGGSFSGTVTATGGSFSGNGSGLTSLNANRITTGEIDDDHLTSNVALLDRSPQYFTGDRNYFNERVGVGTTVAQAHLHIDHTDRSGVPTVFLRRYSTVSGVTLRVLSGRGSSATPSRSNNGDLAFRMQVAGTDAGRSARSLARMDFRVDGTPDSDSVPGRIVFETSSNSQSLVEHMRITSAGRVGIGDNDPMKAKLVVSGTGGDNTLGRNYFRTPPVSAQPTLWLESNGGGTTSDVSIHASDFINSGGIRVSSDARIKDVVGRSNASSDLRRLLQIEITDYSFKDTVAKGSRSQKKVIAQQVEEIYPLAVSRHTDVVPDIYRPAPVKGGWVTLATDLKVGDRVRLIADAEEAVHDVLELREGAFRTAFDPKSAKVFVYGREIDDFRTVDYDALSMLNVSATQELHRLVREQESELAAKSARIAELEGRLATLEERDQRREARLTAIEGMLRSTRPEAALTASTGEASQPE